MVGLIALAAVLHADSLIYPFIIDDYVYLETADQAGWEDVSTILSTATMDHDASGVWWTPFGDLPFYRPLAILTFVLDYHIWGLNAFGFHLTNLLLNLLCIWLTWRLARHLTADRSIAFAAAAVFALHPAHNEAVMWISGRFDLLVCACVLASLIAYMRWQRDRAGQRWAWLCLFFFALGLGCKETAIILPAVVVFGELLRWRGREATYRLGELAVGALGFTVVGVAYLGQRFVLFGGLGTLPPPYGVDFSTSRGFLDVIWNLCQYLLDFVFLVQIDAIYLAAFWDKYPFLLYAAGLAGLAVVAYCWMLAAKREVLRAGMVWAALFTAPALMAMPGERNIYLSCVGVGFIGAGVLAALRARWQDSPLRFQRLKRVATVAVVVGSAMTLIEHGFMWRVAFGSEQVYRDLMTAMPDPPPGARIYVVNQCPLNAVGFNQGVRLRYGRRDITACALTLSPHMEGFSYDEVYRTGPDTVRVDRVGGEFFESFVERFLMFNRPKQLQESAGRFDLSLVNSPDSIEGLTELEFKLPLDLDDERVFLFHWDNRHVQSLTDVIWRAEWPQLVTCPIQSLPDDALVQH